MDFTSAEVLAQFVLVLVQVGKQAFPNSTLRDRVLPFIALTLGILLACGASLRYGTDWFVAIFTGLKAGALAIGEWNLVSAATGGTIAGRSV